MHSLHGSPISGINSCMVKESDTVWLHRSLRNFNRFFLLCNMWNNSHNQQNTTQPKTMERRLSGFTSGWENIKNSSVHKRLSVRRLSFSLFVLSLHTVILHLFQTTKSTRARHGSNKNWLVFSFTHICSLYVVPQQRYSQSSLYWTKK